MGGTKPRAACLGRRFHVRTFRSALQVSELCAFHEGNFWFTVDCIAQCENILSIEHAQLDPAPCPLGVLDKAVLRNVIKAIG